MNQFPPTSNPKLYTLSAMTIGYLLISNFSACEQNAIGNWFMTIGQILENNSAWQQVMEERLQGNTLNINSKKYKSTGYPYMDNEEKIKSPEDFTIDDIKKAIDLIKKELDNLSK